MSPYAKVYHHSGALGMGPVVVPIVGIVAAIALSVAYSYINLYSPVVGVITLGVLVGYSALVGYAIGWAGLLAKCRNRYFVAAMGFICSLIAVYAQWAVFAYALIRRNAEAPLEFTMVDVFLNPAWLWSFILDLNRTGWYAIFDNHQTGLSLWIFWTVEAFTIVGVGTLVASLAFADRVFCERCGQWCRKKSKFMWLKIPDTPEPLDRLTVGEIEMLERFSPANSGEDQYLLVDLQECESCDETTTLQVKCVTTEENRKGEKQQSETKLTGLLLLTQQQRHSVEDLAAKQVEELSQASAEPADSPSPDETV